jgi:flavin reductase (DIM6/NTAB) family NADH-FMN oxidoreductase RutF
MSDKVKLKPSISHFYTTPLVLATCADQQGRPNLLTIASASPCSMDPPTLGIAVNLERYSHGVIADTGEFGVHVPLRADLERSDFCGTISGRDIDKFAESGFTPMPSEVISAPLIAECPINFECRLVHTAHLGTHDWFIGEIVAAHAAPDILADDGTVDPAKLDGVLCSWMQYLLPGAPIARWGFAARK